jgi:putative membrane protein
MKKFNKGQFVWFIILWGFSMYLGYLILTRRIHTYIHPDMVKYTKVCFCGFIILTLYQLRNVFRINRKNKINKGYMIFFIPLILGFTTMGFDSSIADKKGVILTNISQKATHVSNDNEKAGGDYIVDGMVVFNELNHYKILSDMEKKLPKYKGKRVIISGFVYKQDDFSKDRFVIARMTMSCCAADAQVVGLMSKWDNATTLNKGEWINIEGVIDTTLYRDPNTRKEIELPVIVVEKVEKIQAGSQYIYQ